MNDRSTLPNRAGSHTSTGVTSPAVTDLTCARTLLCEALFCRSGFRAQEQIFWCLEGLARVWVSQGQMERAARLLGACETVRRGVGFVLPPQIRSEQEQFAGTVRAALGEAAFNSLHAEGKNMTPEQAIAYAREDA